MLETLRSRIERMESRMPKIPDPADVAVDRFIQRIFRHTQETRNSTLLGLAQDAWLAALENPDLADDEALAQAILTSPNSVSRLAGITPDELRVGLQTLTEWYSEALAEAGAAQWPRRRRGREKKPRSADPRSAPGGTETYSAGLANSPDCPV